VTDNRPAHGARVDDKLLSSIGITDHAVERFVERAQPGRGAAGREEEILRMCMRREGRVTHTRPKWSPSNRSPEPEEWYLQIGEFLLCVMARDDMHDNRWTAVTVVNGARSKTWSKALERGWTQIPLPGASTPSAPPKSARRPPAKARAPVRAPASPPPEPAPATAGAEPSRGSCFVVLLVIAIIIGGMVELLSPNEDRGNRQAARKALAVGVVQQTRNIGAIGLDEAESKAILEDVTEIEFTSSGTDGLRHDLACGKAKAWRLSDKHTIDVCALVDSGSGQPLGSFERTGSKPLAGRNCKGRAVVNEVRCDGR
jgi:hypothetical protein